MATTLKDPGDTGAGDNYVKNSTYKLPNVAIEPGWDTPRSLTGDDTDRVMFPGNDDSKRPDVPTAAPFAVRPSDIRALESAIMSELDTQVAAYANFKKLIADTEGWIFLVQNPKSMIPYKQAIPNGQTSLSAGYAGETYKADFTDPDPKTTQDIVDSQNALVRAVGDSYQLVGEMVALLNNAAQNYVQADKAVFDGGSNYDDYPLNAPPGIQIK